jgi:hypothetical protein
MPVYPLLSADRLRSDFLPLDARCGGAGFLISWLQLVMTRSGWSPVLMLFAGFLALLVDFRLADVFGYLPELPR